MANEPRFGAAPQSELVEAALVAGDGTAAADRPTPRWFGRAFVWTAIFAAIYLLYAWTNVAERGLVAAYDRAVMKNLQEQFAALGMLEADRATIVKYMKDPDYLSYGKGLFKSNCATCHGQEGVGAACPNLVDDHWIHVRGLEDIAAVISKGAKNGAMPAWGTTNKLHQNEIVFLAAYIATLRGNPGVKPPEPEAKVVPPWTE